MSRIFLALVICFCFVPVSAKKIFACEACTISNLGRHQGTVVSESRDKKWFFKYLFEQQAWETIPAEEAHELHHEGHDVHDKTREDFHHFIFGVSCYIIGDIVKRGDMNDRRRR